MLCPLCNAPNRDDAKFCKSCGQSLHSSPQVSAPANEHASFQPAAETEQAGTMTAAQAPAADQPIEALPSPTDKEDDVSLAPTLILTPEKMMAYHSRRWQQESAQAASNPGLVRREDITDLPALTPAVPDDLPTAPSASPAVARNEMIEMAASASAQSQEAINTLMEKPYAEHEQGSPPPPPPPQFDFAATHTFNENAEPKEAQADMIDQPTPEDESSSARIEQTSGEETTAPDADFPVLAIGVLVAGRYEITSVLHEEPEEHTYQVVDHQGYQHCWNCGSEQNAEGDEFCIDCGASLLDMSYVMHEYPASQGNSDSDADVLQGAIVNTFMDKGCTYAIEQPQLNQSNFPNGIHLLSACNSDAGDVRRSDPNEDSTLILQLQRVHESISSPAGVYIVADGMGGHDKGQVASHMAINLIAERMVRELLAGPLQAEKAEAEHQPFDEDALVGLLRGAVEDANLAICQRNQQDKTDMGCTLTGFLISGEHAYIVNVGDSRTYMVRGGQIYQLTTDHSLVGQLVAGGLIEPDDVYTHPQRSQIFRSLGDKPNVQADIFKQQLQPGDILLSCSDGLWEMVRNPQIESILNHAPDPQTACAQLIDAANTNGGEDNISAVIVFAR